MLSMEGGTILISMTEDEKICNTISDAELAQIFKACVTYTSTIAYGCNDCPLRKDPDCENRLSRLIIERFEKLLTDNGTYLELLMKAHDELRTAKSCEICIHKDHCDPLAPYESPQWKIWRTCGEIEKKNYRWRGDKE